MMQVRMQNIALVVSLEALFLVLSSIEHTPIWRANFADWKASLLVVVNGLRPRR
jgi:cation transport ATPase